MIKEELTLEQIAEELKNNHVAWNVIGEEDFGSMLRTIFKSVATVIAKTYGPYGADTILDKNGQVYATKDGWTVLKNLKLFKSATANTLLTLLVNISAQVNMISGDGTTTSMIGANLLLENIDDWLKSHRMRSKDFLDTLKKVITDVTDEIINLSQKITDENIQDIYKVALVSTNTDEKLASIIRDIYVETHNPCIAFSKGKGTETTYEILEGFRIKSKYLDRVYSRGEKTAEIDNPVILIFENKVDKEIFGHKIIFPAMMKAQEEGRKLVVIAPYYDGYMLQEIRNEVNDKLACGKPLDIIYCNSSIINNASRTEYFDFAMFCGCNVITENTKDEVTPKQPIYGKELTEEEIEEDEKRLAAFDVTKYIGEVEHISIGDEYTTISGFVKKNQEVYESYLNDAKANLEEMFEDALEKSFMPSDLFALKKRVSKLSGKMAVIEVGGHTPMAKSATYDLVEDAVKACESAYRFGYNIGGSLIVPIACERLMDDDRPVIEKEMITMIGETFKQVFAVVLKRKYTEKEDNSLVTEIIDNCVKNKTCYDLITDEYSTDIINPTQTDVQVLKAAAEIIGLLLSSNQYLSMTPEM